MVYSHVLKIGFGAMFLACLVGNSLAQPFLKNPPAGMLGQPLYTQELPAGEATVRVIGATLQEAKVGITVELRQRSGESWTKFQTQTTGTDGRARFVGLKGGASYLAIAVEGQREIASHPFNGASDRGVKLMLSTEIASDVSSPAPPAAPSVEKTSPNASPRVAATARSESLPQGHPLPANEPDTVTQSGAAKLVIDRSKEPSQVEIVVREGKAQRPAANVPVAIAIGDNSITGNTDEKGNFVTQIATSVTDEKTAMKASCTFDEITYHSDSFQLAAKENAQLTFTVYQRATSLDGVIIAPGSHLLIHLGEERLTVFQTVRLYNHGERLIDLKSNPLTLPLPNGVENIDIPENVRTFLQTDGKSLTLSAPLPPDLLSLQFTYDLPYTKHFLNVVQTFPLPSSGIDIALINNTTIAIQGPSFLRKEVREHSGSTITIYKLKPTAANQALEFTLVNLPVRQQWPMFATLAFAGLLILWGIWRLARAPKNAFSPSTPLSK